MKGGGSGRVAGLDEVELVVGDWECRCPEQQQQQVSSRSEQAVSLAPSQGVYLVYCVQPIPSLLIGILVRSKILRPPPTDDDSTPVSLCLSSARATIGKAWVPARAASK